MEIGIIGLGRMGAGMAERWLRGGHGVVGYDLDRDAVEGLASRGGVPAFSLEELVRKLEAPRAVWVMLPAGDITERTIETLADMLSPGDTIVEAGNSDYRDDARRAEWLQARGLHFIDQGTSGGVWGLENGYCLMVGGDSHIVQRLEPAFRTLAPADGFVHCGPVGSGHFAKMVHNGIEYGMMQAYAEGFEILRAKEAYNLDLHAIASAWRHGSVVRSWLLDLTETALRQDPDLSGLKGYVEDNGEGRWTIQAAIDLDVPAPVISLALYERFHSRQPESFAAKMVAAMRQGFGGHAIQEAA